ncbi:hypothetical protein BDZ97DRAFT_203423 [Flammula alnicola]|nr:hypothetical protein BDZ97DRAFT_203423 [Flammula alnicola]
MILLVVFNTLQIHTFAIPGVVTRSLCVAVDPMTQVAGAISLWSVKIVLQMRIYVLYKRSRKIATFNGILFAVSLALFLWIMVKNTIRWNLMIVQLVHLPLMGCPVINGGSQRAQWIPDLHYIYKAVVSTAAQTKLNRRPSLTASLLHENILYFFVIACLLQYPREDATNLSYFAKRIEAQPKFITVGSGETARFGDHKRTGLSAHSLYFSQC